MSEFLEFLFGNADRYWAKPCKNVSAVWAVSCKNVYTLRRIDTCVYIPFVALVSCVVVYPWSDFCLVSGTCVDSFQQCRSTCTTWRPAPLAAPSWWRPKWSALNSTWRKRTWWPEITWSPNTSRWIRNTTSPPSTTMAFTWTKAEPFAHIWLTSTERMTLSTQKIPKFVPWSTNASTLTWASSTIVSA